CRKHFGNMAGHFDLAPLLRQLAVLVDQEGAALNAHEFLAVHFLKLDHVEQLAQGAILVAEQLERKLLLALEVVVTASGCPVKRRECRSWLSGTACSDRGNPGLRWCSRGCCPSGRNTAPVACP